MLRLYGNGVDTGEDHRKHEGGSSRRVRFERFL